MKVFAALDLKGGAAVQLVGGDPEDERVRLPSPADVARRWARAGFRNFHVVDLDAALGTGSNADGLAAVARALAGSAARPHTLQVGGGIRDGAAIESVLTLGADRVIVGTRAVEDRAWLEEAASAWPARLVVAADVRDGVVVTRGWRASTALDAGDFVRGLAAVPLAGVLVTDVSREGRQQGIDRRLFADLAAASSWPLLAAGGIAGGDDLMALRDVGAAGAVLGMALYTGRLDPAVALEMEEDA